MAAAALVEGASTPGQGQGAMQKIYWQRLGELVEKKEHTGKDGGPIQTLDLSKLTKEPIYRINGSKFMIDVEAFDRWLESRMAER